MRVLTVCVSSSVFGAEVVTLKMLEGLQRSGHQQLAITTIWTDGEFNRRLVRLGIPEVRLPFGMLSKKLALRPLWWTTKMLSHLPILWRGWRRVLDKFNPDVVLFTSWRHVLAAYPVIDGRPSFLIEHSYLAPTPTRRLLYRLFARKLSGFIAVSDFLGNHVAKVGAPAAKVHVIRNGVFSIADRAQIEHEYSQFPQPVPGQVRIGIVGQIAPHKGHFCLLEAVDRLRKTGRTLDVFIFGVGDDKYTSELKVKMSQLELTDVFHWMGYRSNRTDIYAQIDVVVVPSLSGDPFPTVAMEAGAYGRPVIASRAGGLPEIIEDGVTGWLVTAGDPKDLAAKIEEFIDNPAAIKKMGEEARDRIFSEFTQEKMVAQFEEVLNGVQERARAAQ